jgi:hypothetical protein
MVALTQQPRLLDRIKTLLIVRAFTMVLIVASTRVEPLFDSQVIQVFGDVFNVGLWSSLLVAVLWRILELRFVTNPPDCCADCECTLPSFRWIVDFVRKCRIRRDFSCPTGDEGHLVQCQSMEVYWPSPVFVTVSSRSKEYDRLEKTWEESIEMTHYSFPGREKAGISPLKAPERFVLDRGDTFEWLTQRSHDLHSKVQ